MRAKDITSWAKNRPYIFLPPTIKRVILEADLRFIAATKPALKLFEALHRYTCRHAGCRDFSVAPVDMKRWKFLFLDRGLILPTFH